MSEASWPELTTCWAYSSARIPACCARRTIVSVSSASLTCSSSLRAMASRTNWALIASRAPSSISLSMSAAALPSISA
jgi:hypothetical protein